MIPYPYLKQSIVTHLQNAVHERECTNKRQTTVTDISHTTIPTGELGSLSIEGGFDRCYAMKGFTSGDSNGRRTVRPQRNY